VFSLPPKPAVAAGILADVFGGLYPSAGGRPGGPEPGRVGQTGGARGGVAICCLRRVGD
jgi:hypothetical protein